MGLEHLLGAFYLTECVLDEESQLVAFDSHEPNSVSVYSANQGKPHTIFFLVIEHLHRIEHSLEYLSSVFTFYQCIGLSQIRSQRILLERTSMTNLTGGVLQRN